MAARRTRRDPDLYEVLGVGPDADATELRRAYRRRLRQLHPDTRQALDRRVANPDAEGQYRLNLATVLYAYQVLRDPTRRASYDAERTVSSARRRYPPPGAGSRSKASGITRPVSRHQTDSRVVIKIGPVRIELELDRESP